MNFNKFERFNQYLIDFYKIDDLLKKNCPITILKIKKFNQL